MLCWHQSRQLVPRDLSDFQVSTVGNRAFTVAGPRVWNTAEGKDIANHAPPERRRNAHLSVVAVESVGG